METKLYHLFNMPWQTIVGQIPEEEKKNIAIFRLIKVEAANQYAIISDSVKVDKILIERFSASRQITEKELSTFITEDIDNFPYIFGNKELVPKLSLDSAFDIDSIKWHHFALEFLPDGKKVLFIICENVSQSTSLYKFMRSNKYELSANKEGKVLFHVIFSTLFKRLSLNSNQTRESCPNLIWLDDGTLGYIGFGAAPNTKEEGEMDGEIFTHLIALESGVRWN